MACAPSSLILAKHLCAPYGGAIRIRELLMFDWKVETKLQAYSQLSLLVFLYRLLFKPKGYRELVHHRLFKKDSKIYYQVGGATYWIMNISDFSRFEKLSAKSNFSDGYEVRVHTKNNDVYSMECTLDVSSFKNMELVVSEDWCNV